jgi:hypothetical protein
LYRAGPAKAPAATEKIAKPKPIAPSTRIGTYGFDVGITYEILKCLGLFQ